MDLKRYDIDPVLLCRCGSVESEPHMVSVVGGRYVEAEEAEAKIERLKVELAVANEVVRLFKKGCSDMIDRLRTGEL